MIIRSIKYTLILMTLSCVSLAQPGPPGDPSEDPDNPVPITGIEILLASGAALGLKRMYDAKKKVE